MTQSLFEITDKPPPETFSETCARLEHWETPAWAVEGILKKEILTSIVVDPCTGTGVIARAARLAGYEVAASDIHDWGFPNTHLADFLAMAPDDALGMLIRGNTVLKNPPFSKAVEFVEKAIALGARKIVCFQRFAWWESRGRREFWDKNPPNRVYICGDRATCWRHDIPTEARATGNTSTAHAWFVWEPGHPGGTQLGHIYKDTAA